MTKCNIPLPDIPGLPIPSFSLGLIGVELPELPEIPVLPIPSVEFQLVTDDAQAAQAISLGKIPVPVVVPPGLPVPSFSLGIIGIELPELPEIPTLPIPSVEFQLVTDDAQAAQAISAGKIPVPVVVPPGLPIPSFSPSLLGVELPELPEIPALPACPLDLI